MIFVKYMLPSSNTYGGAYQTIGYGKYQSADVERLTNASLKC